VSSRAITQLQPNLMPESWMMERSWCGSSKNAIGVSSVTNWSIPGFVHTWFCVTQLRQVALL
jgi:hypothetical protein